MKKYLAGLATGLILATTTFAFAAPQAVKLIVNGKTITFPDAPPQMLNNRVMVPARPLAEALGAKVDWDAARNAVVVTSGAQAGGMPTDLPPVQTGQGQTPTQQADAQTSAPATYSLGDTVDLDTVKVIVHGIEYSSSYEGAITDQNDTFGLVDLSVFVNQIDSKASQSTPDVIISAIRLSNGKNAGSGFLKGTNIQQLKFGEWVHVKLGVSISKKDKIQSIEIYNLGDKSTLKTAIISVS